MKTPQKDFALQLIQWYNTHKRALPWRTTRDPYCIWLSEIIMQQTQVAQGLPYYNRFLKAYPNVFALANASEDEVLKLWQGLGYYSRARNLHATSKYVATKLGGKFPTTYKDLKSLKGVGDYTASAIASICFKLPHAVVDGNVYRVLSRFFGNDTPIDTTAGQKVFKALASELLDHEQPGIYNQALMEFGARQCKPAKPNCEVCIFSSVCVAFQTNTVSKLPIKARKIKVKTRYLNYLVFLDGKNTLLKKRTEKGIWLHLYEFPLVESTQLLTKETLLNAILALNINALKNVNDINSTFSKINKDPVLHKLTHQHLYINFWKIRVPFKLKEGIAYSALKKYPKPVVLENFIESYSVFHE